MILRKKNFSRIQTNAKPNASVCNAKPYMRKMRARVEGAIWRKCERALKKFGMRFFLTFLRCVHLTKIHDNVCRISCLSI